MASTRPSTPSLNRKYLRACHDYQPAHSTLSSTTGGVSVTVPLTEGDIILVHLTHANGWADGTVLQTGARGWIPTNFCEVYDHPFIRSLMHGLTQLWDYLSSGGVGKVMLDERQDYVQGLIAGVRRLLVRLGSVSSHLLRLTMYRSTAIVCTEKTGSFRSTLVCGGLGRVFLQIWLCSSSLVKRYRAHSRPSLRQKCLGRALMVTCQRLSRRPAARSASWIFGFKARRRRACTAQPPLSTARLESRFHLPLRFLLRQVRPRICAWLTRQMQKPVRTKAVTFTRRTRKGTLLVGLDQSPRRTASLYVQSRLWRRYPSHVCRHALPLRTVDLLLYWASDGRTTHQPQTRHLTRAGSHLSGLQLHMTASSGK